MGTLDGNKKMRRAGSRCQASENSTCSPLMEYPVPINSLLNLSRIPTPIKSPIKRQGRAFFIFIFYLLSFPSLTPWVLWENWGWLRCHDFLMNSGVQAYIDPQIYRGLGFGLNCRGARSCKQRRKRQTGGKDRTTVADRQTGEEANIHSRNVAAGWCCRGNGLSQTQCEASDTEGSLTTTTGRQRGVSNTNAMKPGPQWASGYLNDDSNGL